jgi:LacI family transcriptional regulator
MGETEDSGGSAAGTVELAPPGEWVRAARTTIDDVAARAGVSIKTVSRVMNDEPGVRTETRQRVREAMAALNYQPSLPARSLAGRRSNLIGLVYENPSANYVFDVQSGAMAKCRDSNLRLFIQSCNDLGTEPIAEIMAMLEQTHVDGLVLTPPLSADHALIGALDERHLPFVRIAPDDMAHGSPAVEMDDQAAAQEMTAYLFDLGHRDVAFVSGHPGHHSSRLRLAGYRAERERRGLPVKSERVEQGFNTVESGIEAGHRLLEGKSPPSAIFASNDDMAAGVLRIAHELGLEVPGSLSVAGFDDSQLAKIVWPPLTTVRQPSYDMAYAATDLLISRLKGQAVPQVRRLEHEMVIRGSTGPPF